MALSNPRRTSQDDEDREDGGARMGFLEHLDELRSRLIRSCTAIAAGMAVS
jgi:Sec-independent protein secretion pathway component TatC